MLLVSVIVPAKDAENTLGACLKALNNQDGFEPGKDYEIIVVDDGSQDGTKQIAQKWAARVASQSNAGPASARNTGARMALGTYLAFTDADCIPEHDWLAQLMQPFGNPNIIGVKGAYRTQEQALISRFVQIEYEYKYSRMKRLKAIDFIDTYSAAYRRDVFLENDGFNELFPVPSVEDQELSFRLSRKGYLMIFQPDAIVHHRHDSSIWEYIARKFGIGYWKALMLRWLPEKTLLDSHTPSSQRWQIVLLAFVILCGATSLFLPYAGWLAVVSLALFYLFCIPFLGYVWVNNRQVFLLTAILLIIRALSLGLGLIIGLIFPTRKAFVARDGLSIVERFIKRCVDIVGASAGLFLSLPIIAICAIAIRLEGKGPIFFVQRRIGENGKSFQMYKLRTMIIDAEDRVTKVFHQSMLEATGCKKSDDPRVTKVGRLFRRWSLDKLPQFWNVLKGEMSLVGPRPEETWVVEQYSDNQRRCLLIKPGITGSMQVAGRGDLNMENRFEMEIDYIKNYSIWRDIHILLRTISVIITGKGA